MLHLLRHVIRVCHRTQAACLLAAALLAPLALLPQVARADAATQDVAAGSETKASDSLPFPSFEVMDDKNQWVDSHSWFGDRPVLVDFWATFCGPCRFTLPELQRIHEEYGGALGVVGITVDSGRGGGFRARTWAAERGVVYPQYHDLKAEGRKAYDVRTIPVLVLVGTDGNVVTDWWGEPDFDEVRAAVAGLLGPPPAGDDDQAAAGADGSP